MRGPEKHSELGFGLGGVVPLALLVWEVKGLLIPSVRLLTNRHSVEALIEAHQTQPGPPTASNYGYKIRKLEKVRQNNLASCVGRQGVLLLC